MPEAAILKYDMLSCD